MLRKTKKIILKQLGINQLIENQIYIKKSLDSLSQKEDELLKAFIFNNTIADSIWLKHKSFSPGGWAVDYSFLYTLYRVLNDVSPKSILEFGLGQSSKLIHQYAHFYDDVNALTCEHDPEWISFFKNSINEDYDFVIWNVELEEILYKGEKTLTYKGLNSIFNGKKYDLIVVDAPFGSPRYSRSQILYLAKNNLSDSFCIIIDDFERVGEQETAKELTCILDEKNIRYSSALYRGSKQHFLICSETLKFLTSM
jgi:hypothetical protein